MKMTFSFNENNFGKAQNFFAKYDLVSMLGDTKEEFVLGNKKGKVCRFCHKTETEVKFKKDAHVIPEFMGNHNLLSYFECDECNELFAKYEDSFANYIGISRTISQIKGKNKKVPKYVDPRTGLEVTVTDKGIQISALEGTDVFEIDKEKKSFLLKTRKPGYTPIHIPKILLKMGFCMLQEDELNDFEYTRKFIIDTKNQDKFKDSNMLRIFGYYIPGPPKFNTPFIQLYRKKDLESTQKVPYYQLIFYYASYQLQIVLPFGKADESLQGTNVDVPIAPLLVDNSYLERYGQETFLNLNLTSSEKKSGETGNITFSFESFTDVDLTK